jgi:site-specific DNA-methyltransferase (adenine-specific)
MKNTLYTSEDLKIIHDDICQTISVANNSIDLIVTSPPYNLNIGYGSNDDNLGYDEYLQFSARWMKKCFDLAKDDGRFCLNIPLDKNKWWHNSVYSDLTLIAKRAWWHYFSTVVWNEWNISRRTAWGSWLSASAPYVIAPVEMIVIFYKKQWKKLKRWESSISKEEFMEWTNGIWTFNGESKKRIGHPAPFPIELPKRCIQLFSYKDDVVFDPFMWSGTTLIAAGLYWRKGVGIDIDKAYCELAKSRIENTLPNFIFKSHVYDKETKIFPIRVDTGILQTVS